MHTFTFLHISDLHERGPHEREPVRRQRVLGDAWQRQIADLTREVEVDFVCFTGDVANSGRAEEYAQVERFLEPLLQQLKLDSTRLFVVPGNHDIDRTVGEKAWRQLRDGLRHVEPVRISRWVGSQGKTPQGLEDFWLDEVLARQAAYRQWLRSFGLGALTVAPSGGRLGYRTSLQVRDLPFDIHVIGLDSAWLSGDKDESGQLLLTDAQVLSCCHDSKGGKLPGFRLALMHHPLSHVADGMACQRRLAESVDLLLRGHLQNKVPELWADEDRRSLRAFAAGCLYSEEGADCYPNSCIVVRVTCDAAGRAQHFDLRLRSFDPDGGHWHDDTGRLSGQVRGSWLRLLATSATSAPTPDVRRRQQWHSRGGVAGVAASLTLVAAIALRPSCSQNQVPAVPDTLQPQHLQGSGNWLSASNRPLPRARWKINTKPPGAAVIGPDGKKLGETPWTGTSEMASGVTRLQLKKPGYDDAILPLDNDRDVEETVQLRLVRIQGYIPPK